MVKVFAGADPGLTGAVVLYAPDQGRVCVLDIPTRHIAGAAKARVKREADPAALDAKTRGALAGIGGALEAVMLERVGSRPRQGAATTFSLGDSFGVIRAVLEALAPDPEKVQYSIPAVWKRSVGLEPGANKQDSVAMACQLCPAMVEHLRRKKDHDRAEAFLLAWLASKNFSL